MMFPPKLLKAHLDAFDDRIADGEKVLATIKVSAHPMLLDPTGSPKQVHTVDWPTFVQWRTRCTSLVDAILVPRSVHRQMLDKMRVMGGQKSNVGFILAFLRALKLDLTEGRLESLSSQIEGEIAADYMGQAERLLDEGQPGKYDHVPAAVLAGAVLEKSLRELCGRQTPPVATINARGEPLMLNSLIDDLKKAGLFNELKAKQLRAWADIRNKAAHGEFGAFVRQDVEVMLKGVQQFLGDYM